MLLFLLDVLSLVLVVNVLLLLRVIVGRIVVSGVRRFVLGVVCIAVSGVVMSFEKKIYRSIDRRGGEEKFGFENEIKYRFQNVQNGQKNKVFPQKRFPFFAQEFEPNSSKR